MSLAVPIPGNDLESNSVLRHRTRLAGIGTAVPPYAATQEEALGFMERVLIAANQASAGQLALQRRIYRNSGIQRRQSVLEDYIRADANHNTFFPPNAALEPFPSTACRMEAYEKESIGLAQLAASRALEAAEIPAGEITHLVISTCTGFFAPGLDVLLVRSLGLPNQVNRTILGFMGCYAGISSMQLCHKLVQADANAKVLQVAVELCSLHFQRDSTPDTMVANAIFSDGAAAAVYTGTPSSNGESMPEVIGARTEIAPDSLEGMSWRIGDTGFVMRLDPQVPDLLKKCAARFVQDMAESVGVFPGDIDGWAIHPGGRRILEAVAESLQIGPDNMESSYSVLRDHGNMSSATILFVLERELRNRNKGIIAGLAFGPGLTIEGVLLRAG